MKKTPTLIDPSPATAQSLAHLQEQYDLPEYAVARLAASELKKRLYAAGFIHDAQIMLEIDDCLGVHAAPEDDEGPLTDYEAMFSYSRAGADLDLVLFECARRVQEHPETAMHDWQVYAVEHLARSGPICPWSAAARYVG